MLNAMTLRTHCLRFAGLAGVLAIAAGLLVLAGWAWNLDPLKRGFPGLVAVNPATAVAFMLGGLSLWLQRREPAGIPRNAATSVYPARGAALLMVAIGALRLGGYGLGWDHDIDQLLFTDKLLADTPSLPNRMAPNTAFNLVLLGLALFMLDVTTVRNRRPSELFAACAGLIALLALFGYVYQVTQLYGVAAYIPMALHTAIVSCVLALGLLCARPDRGVMALVTSASMGGSLVRRLFPTMVLAMFVLGWLRLEGQRRGLFGLEPGIALYTIANIALFGVLVGWSASALHRLEGERAHAEAARDKALALNRMIMDNSLDVICAIDGDGRFVKVSAASEQLWGYAPSELVGRAYADMVHPDDAAMTAEVAASIMDGRPTVDFNNRYLRKDGSTIEIDWSAAWSKPDGMMFCVARDATRRKLAEQRLRQSEEHVRSIIDTAQDAFVAIDADGVVTDWNAQSETAFGWPRAEAIGHRLSEIIIPLRYRQAHEQGLRRFLETGQGAVLNRRIELSALHRSGSEFPIELTIWPLKTGESFRFNAFIRDITERKQTEQAILALNAELTANAVMLQQTNDELESFSYSVSHDLRAPLRHIDGYARMLQEDAADKLDGDMQRYLDTIGDSARRMGMLIDDLLAFSRLGRQPVERIMVDMNALAEHALQEVAGARPDASRVRMTPLPAAHVDPILLRQVWVNLLSNALKYSATRGDAAQIDISGERDGNVTRYRVRDNGVGFDMRYADKLFGVFQRLHGQDEFEGTGVGLAIVHRVITRHGGRVWAEAEPDRGATFTIELPVAEPAIQEDTA